MLLTHVHVSRFKSVEDSSVFGVEPDVTCLVGKNESGNGPGRLNHYRPAVEVLRHQSELLGRLNALLR
jgi:hypothetical protein